MTNMTVTILYGALAIPVLLVIVFSLLQDKKHRLTANTVFYAAMVLGWLLTRILYYTSTSLNSAFFLYDLDLPFVAFTVLAAFLFVTRFYNFNAFLSGPIIAVLCVIPAITMLLSFTNAYQDFLRPGLRIVELAPLHVAEGTRGVWFWIHAGYSYLLTMITCLLMAVRHRRLPRIYRMPSWLLVTGFLISVAGNLLVIMDLFDVPLDFSLIGGSITAVFLYFANSKNQGMDFLSQARNEIYNSLPDGVSILDDQGVVIGCNQTAQDYADRVALGKLEDATYSGLKQGLTRISSQRIVHDEADSGVDYTLMVGGAEKTFNFREKAVQDKRGQRIGMFLVCSDVSENRQLINRLEAEAGIDALTGLMNRTRMNEEMAMFDKPEHLPLSVIMADLNNLKVVNDTMGHHQGDVMLRAAAEALSSRCPPNARLGRIGGDEFLVLLPGTSQAQASDIVKDLRNYLETVHSYPFELSIALGSAGKDRASAKLEDAVALADERMYEDKARIKGGRKAIR